MVVFDDRTTLFFPLIVCPVPIHKEDSGPESQKEVDRTVRVGGGGVRRDQSASPFSASRLEEEWASYYFGEDSDLDAPGEDRTNAAQACFIERGKLLRAV